MAESTASTAAGEDHLTALPSEILQMIIGLLFPTHFEDKALLHPAALARLQGGPCHHSLDHLAATCKLLRLEVNDWAHHFLVQHRDITKFKEAKRPVAKGREKKHVFCTNYLRNSSNASKGLLTWCSKKCAFCGKNSQRSAVFMSGLMCCNKCDKKEWPDKITKTQALAEFDLKKYHLLPHQEHLGSYARMNFDDLGVSRLRYGSYFSCNVPTTMFLKKDVEKLAERVHGNVAAHMAERAQAREDRKKKIEENRPVREAKAQAKAAKASAEARQQAAQAAIARSIALPQGPIEISDDDSESEDDFGGSSTGHILIEDADGV